MNRREFTEDSPVLMDLAGFSSEGAKSLWSPTSHESSPIVGRNVHGATDLLAMPFRFCHAHKNNIPLLTELESLSVRSLQIFRSSRSESSG